LIFPIVEFESLSMYQLIALNNVQFGITTNHKEKWESWWMGLMFESVNLRGV